MELNNEDFYYRGCERSAFPDKLHDGIDRLELYMLFAMQGLLAAGADTAYSQKDIAYKALVQAQYTLEQYEMFEAQSLSKMKEGSNG